MKKFLLAASLCIGAFGAIAQTPTFNWAKLIDSSNGDLPGSLVVSNDGKMLAFCNFGSKADGDAVFYDGVQVGSGCATTANSDNLNMLLMKIDIDGAKLWNVYSDQGDIAIATSSVAATPDGGAIAALKMRYASGYSDKTPRLVDASGVQTLIADWNTGYRTYYVVLVKIDKNGNIEWTKKIDVDNSPEANASATYSAGTPDGVDANAIAADEDGYIYLGGRFRKAVTFSKVSGETVTLTPHNTVAWTGDSQTVNGDMFIVKLDAEGNYLKHIVSEDVIARDQVSDMVYADGKLYFYGNMKAAADGDQVVLGGVSLSPSSLDDIVFGCVDKELNVVYARNIKAYPASNNKHTTQCKTLDLIGGNLYMTGHIVGGFGPDNTTVASIASAGTMQEGFAIKCNAADGEWIGGVTNGKTIGGYYGVVKNTEKTYFYGYKLGEIFMDEYDENSFTKTGEIALVTGGGMSTAYSCLQIGDRFYSFSRCNANAPSQFYDTDVTLTSQGWGNVISCWTIGSTGTGIVGVSENSSKMYGAQGALVVETENAVAVQVYGITGQQMYSGVADAGISRIELPKGIYVVNKKKVIVY